VRAYVLDMARTWIVLGHAAGVRILESRGPASDLTTVRETPFPWAAQKGQDLVTDKPGRRFHPGQAGERRSTMEPPDPVEHNVNVFAKQVADALDKDRAANRFDRLVLVSEPSFLGKLRDGLSAPTRRMVEGSVDKDLASADTGQIRRALEDVILV
jgi:protein required for attachment to host cells